MSESRAVVLLSGGSGSATALAYAKVSGMKVHALAVHGVDDDLLELVAAARVAATNNVTFHTRCVENWRTDTSGLVLLAQAASLATLLDAKYVLTGTCAGRTEPHHQDSFHALFGKVVGIASPLDRDVTFFAPCLALDRDEVLRWGSETLGVDYSKTDDCVGKRRTKDVSKAVRLHCGQCDGCRTRKAAFAAANLQDPARYELAAVG